MRVSAIVKPNSKHREEVVFCDDGSVGIFTKAAAVEGRANAAAVKLLAKHFGVSKSRVRLVRGGTSKYKVFEIDVDPAEEHRKREIADQVVIMNQVIL